MFIKIKKQIKNVFSKFNLFNLASLIGFLGAYGGSQNTSLLWRRIGISLIFTICALISTKSFWSIIVMSMWGFLAMGYGIPDETDEGSILARVYIKLFKNNLFLTNVFTRGTIGLGISLSLLIVTILRQNWLIYVLSSLGIILVYAFNSWRGYGQFIFIWKNKNYYLLYVDLVTYTILGLCGLLIIFK